MRWIGTMICLAVVLEACTARQGAAPQAPNGFIVLGPRAASTFGMADRDSLAEVRVADVPPNVRTSSRAVADSLRFTDACSRYFRRQASYVVLLRVRCETGERIEDGEAMAAFDASGRPKGSTIPSVTTDDYRALGAGTGPQ